MRGAELTCDSQGGIVRETEIKCALHGHRIILKIRHTGSVAVEILLGQTSNLVEIRNLQSRLSRIVHRTCQRVIRQRVLLNFANLGIVYNLIAVPLHTIERRFLVLSLTRETEANQSAVSRDIATFVLNLLFVYGTGEVYHQRIEHTIVEITLPADHTFELARRRFQGDNLCTTDSFTDAGRSTTKNDLNFSDSVFGHRHTGTLTDVTLHGHHATLTTGGTGTTITVADATDSCHNTLNRGTRHLCDIIARQTRTRFGCTNLNDGHFLFDDFNCIEHCGRWVKFNVDNGETGSLDINAGADIRGVTHEAHLNVILADGQRLDGEDTIEVGDADKNLFTVLLGNDVNHRHGIFSLGIDDGSLHRALCQRGNLCHQQEPKRQ